MFSRTKFFSKYRKEIILGPFFKLLEAIFELCIPLVCIRIIDIGISQSRHQYVIIMAAFMIVLGMIGFGCAVVAQYYAASVATSFSTDLRHLLFEKIGMLRLEQIQKLESATLITRMTSDINQVQTGINLTLRLLLRSPFIVFGAAIMAFLVEPKGAVVFVIVIPILALIIFTILLISMPVYQKIQKKMDAVMILTRENLAGARVIRAFHNEKKEIETYTSTQEELTKIQTFASKISAFLNPITIAIINLAILIILWKLGKLAEVGLVTGGVLIALVNYMSQILVELVKLANLMISISKAMASGKRIESILCLDTVGETADFEKEKTLEAKNQESVDASSDDEIISFQDVSFCYPEVLVPALKSITLSVNRKETLGLIGGTGSGKTTLVNLLPKLFCVSEGAIMIQGKNVNHYEPNILRKKIAMVTQDIVLFTGTIRENLLWGKPDATQEEMWEALEIAQAHFVKEKEEKLELYLQKGGKNLSGGQRQRLAIARALISKPEILVLDDSSSALDNLTDTAFRKALQQLPWEVTVIMVSQRTAAVMHASKIVVLEDGEMIGMGKHDELLTNCQLYKEIHESQFVAAGE